jgi:hypothetical protein
MKMWLVKLPGNEGVLFDNEGDAMHAAGTLRLNPVSSLADRIAEDREFSRDDAVYEVVEVDAPWFEEPQYSKRRAGRVRL